MRIAAICNTDSLAFPSLRSLIDKGILVSVALPEKSKPFLYGALKGVMGADNLVTIAAKERNSQLESWLKKYTPDAVWVFGCPWKIPQQLLEIPAHGFINFHFGLMPAYSGADPVFWQIRNQEKKCGLVVHRMSEEIDQGPVIWREETDAVPGENYAMHCIRMGSVAAQIQEKVLEQLSLPGESAAPLKDGPFPYWNKPGTAELTIRWREQGSADIIALIHAANPKYDGATTTLRGMELRILEADVIDVNGDVEAEAGTIVHADALYGVIVACCDKKFIRLNVIHLREGYVSGVKLFAFGARAGERFD